MAGYSKWSEIKRRKGESDPSVLEALRELEPAWAGLDAATPAGWHVGQPSHHTDRHEWILYAFDSSERVKVGRRKRDWEAAAPEDQGALGAVRGNDAMSRRDSGSPGAEVGG